MVGMVRVSLTLKMSPGWRPEGDEAMCDTEGLEEGQEKGRKSRWLFQVSLWVMSSCDVQFSSNSGSLFQTVHYPSPVSHHNETHPSFPVIETSVEEDWTPWPPPKPSFGTLLIPDFPLDAPQITPFEVQEETQRGVVWLFRKPSAFFHWEKAFLVAFHYLWVYTDPRHP